MHIGRGQICDAVRDIAASFEEKLCWHYSFGRVARWNSLLFTAR